jgi:hypothetical protein
LAVTDAPSIALRYRAGTVQIERNKYVLLCCAVAAGCGSAQPAPVPSQQMPVAPAPGAREVVAPPTPTAPTVATEAAQSSEPASRPRPARTGDAELDAVGEDLEKILDARRDCNPPPSREYLAQLEVQQAREMPRKESPVRASCERIELPEQGKGAACEEPSFDCYAAVKMFRPESARAFIACLTPKSKTRAMCGHAPGNCVAQTVNATRPSPQVTAVCARIAKRCRTVGGKPLAEMTCRKYLTAVDCDELPTAGYCLANGCSLRQCFDPLD